MKTVAGLFILLFSLNVFATQAFFCETSDGDTQFWNNENKSITVQTYANGSKEEFKISSSLVKDFGIFQNTIVLTYGKELKLRAYNNLMWQIFQYKGKVDFNIKRENTSFKYSGDVVCETSTSI